MKDIAFVKPGIYRFTLWYDNLNSRTLICKENYIYYLFDAHGAFCYARSFASFGCPYFVLYFSLGLVKVNPRLIASDDICERSIVVFRELFQQLFCDSHRSKFLLFCNEILLIFESRLRIVWAAPTEIPKHLAICLVVNLASVATKFVTFSTIFCGVAIFGRRTWGASSTESTPLLNILHHRVTDEKRKFVVPINTTYFIKYVFRLYTKNTTVRDIGPYFGQWRQTFLVSLTSYFFLCTHCAHNVEATLNECYCLYAVCLLGKLDMH